MRRGGSSQGPIGRVAGIGAVDGPNVIARIRMIQRVAALDTVRIPGTAGRSFQEILENRSWGSSSIPEGFAGRVSAKVSERRPLPPTREELEEALEVAEEGSFLTRLAKKLL